MILQLSDKIKKFRVEQAIDDLNKNPVKNLPKLLDWADTFCAGKFEGQRRAIRKACLDPTDAHYPMVQHILNDNMLRPCPMLENPEKLRRIVVESGAHSTDPMSPETAEHLCSKCDGYAACWTPVAEELWRGSPDEARYLAKQAAATAKNK